MNLKRGWRNPFVTIGTAVVSLVMAYGVAVPVLYANRILPGVAVGGLQVSGKTAPEVETEINKQAAKLTEFRFTNQGQTVTVKATDIKLGVDAKATAEAAKKVGRGEGLSGWLQPYAAAIGNRDVPLVYTFDQQALAAQLAAQTTGLKPARNAIIVRQGGEFRIVSEAPGRIADPAANAQELRRAIETYRTELPLYIRDQQPQIGARDLGTTKAYAEMLAGRPFTVTAGDRRFTASPTEVASWITFEPRTRTFLYNDLLAASPFSRIDQALGTTGDDAPIIRDSAKTLFAVADTETIGQFVKTVAEQVDKPPVNARVAFQNNQLTVAGAPQDGQVVDRSQAVRAVAANLKSPDRLTAVKITAKSADIRAETLPSLGIKSLIGSSTTTFSGSPPNRVFNIAVGASKFDSVLIKPGQIFSFNDVLGDVGSETGYRQELVILENRTEKQYGGGLCQVSTTMFRAAMASGLPIAERTNHSYAVHYYAPTGMDATIYPGGPDMKFKNNTPGYILVQTRQEGTSLTFDFYGTADGRTSATDIMYINANEASGGTAAFRYTVTGGAEPINRVFSSTYKPQSAFPQTNSLN